MYLVSCLTLTDDVVHLYDFMNRSSDFIFPSFLCLKD